MANGGTGKWENGIRGIVRSAGFLALAASVLTVDPSAAGVKTKTGGKTPARTSSAAKAELKECLRHPNAACLGKFVPERWYFPDQADFGCATAGTPKDFITRGEFVRCALTSEKARHGCGDVDQTLLETLKDCFLAEKPEGGSVCQLEEEEGLLRIGSVACGC